MHEQSVVGQFRKLHPCRMAMSANDAADAARGRALDCTPTAEMRTSLDAEITDEELTALSKEMIVWLEESLQKKNQPMQNWYSLFRAADADGVARCSPAPPHPPRFADPCASALGLCTHPRADSTRACAPFRRLWLHYLRRAADCGAEYSAQGREESVSVAKVQRV